MENTYTKALQIMSNVIYEYVHKQIARAKFDQIFTAKITEYINPKKCKVLRNGNTITCDIYTPYEVGDFVKVCIPCNNTNDTFVIVNCSR